MSTTPSKQWFIIHDKVQQEQSAFNHILESLDANLSSANKLREYYDHQIANTINHIQTNLLKGGCTGDLINLLCKVFSCDANGLQRRFSDTAKQSILASNSLDEASESLSAIEQRCTECQQRLNSSRNAIYTQEQADISRDLSKLCLEAVSNGYSDANISVEARSSSFRRWIPGLNKRRKLFRNIANLLEEAAILPEINRLNQKATPDRVFDILIDAEISVCGAESEISDTLKERAELLEQLTIAKQNYTEAKIKSDVYSGLRKGVTFSEYAQWEALNLSLNDTNIKHISRIFGDDELYNTYNSAFTKRETLNALINVILESKNNLVDLRLNLQSYLDQLNDIRTMTEFTVPCNLPSSISNYRQDMLKSVYTNQNTIEAIESHHIAARESFGDIFRFIKQASIDPIAFSITKAPKLNEHIALSHLATTA